jgi:hypothetical protein
MTNHTIKYNSSSVHITGLGMKTAATNEFTFSACASLTRHGHRMQTAKTGEIETAEQALKTAKALARSMGKKVCKTCEAHALAEQTAGKTFRFLISTDELDETGTEVTVTAADRREAKAKARQLPGVFAVTALD